MTYFIWQVKKSKTALKSFMGAGGRHMGPRAKDWEKNKYLQLNKLFKWRVCLYFANVEAKIICLDNKYVWGRHSDIFVVSNQICWQTSLQISCTLCRQLSFLKSCDFFSIFQHVSLRSHWQQFRHLMERTQVWIWHRQINKP